MPPCCMSLSRRRLHACSRFWLLKAFSTLIRTRALQKQGDGGEPAWLPEPLPFFTHFLPCHYLSVSANWITKACALCAAPGRVRSPPRPRGSRHKRGVGRKGRAPRIHLHPSPSPAPWDLVYLNTSWVSQGNPAPGIRQTFIPLFSLAEWIAAGPFFFLQKNLGNSSGLVSPLVLMGEDLRRGSEPQQEPRHFRLLAHPEVNASLLHGFPPTQVSAQPARGFIYGLGCSAAKRLELLASGVIITLPS